MIKHVLIGVFAAFVAIVIVAVAQPKDAPTVSLDPKLVKIDDLETFLPKPEKLRRPSVTRPVNPLDKIVPEVSFENTALADALEFLRDATGANFLANWRALEATGIERNTPVTVKLRDATAGAVLSAILDSAGGGSVVVMFRHKNGIVQVSTAEDLMRDADIRLYNVRDLLIEAMRFHRSFDHAARAGDVATTQPGFGGSVGPPGAPTGWYESDLVDQLRQLIMNCAGRDSWVDHGGNIGFCHYWAGKLLIVQTPENHDQIERFLHMLREE